MISQNKFTSFPFIFSPNKFIFMKRILTTSFFLALFCSSGFSQENTPWGPFAGASNLTEITYFKIFDGIPQINGTYLAIGDYVAALNENAELAGVLEITELVEDEVPFFNIQIFQDAASTSEREGPTAGENYSLQYYDLSTNTYWKLDDFGPWTHTNQHGDAADGDDPNQFFWNATTQVASPLYVDLLDFTAYEDNGNVQLEWSTVSEKDNDFFTIEKSKDGRSFSAIGTVQSAGDNTKQQDYYFVDHTPFAGINYYRLKNTSFDGKSDYSQTVSVLIEEKVATTISFFPNPVTTHLNVEISSNYSEKVLGLELFDVTGRLALSKTLDIADSFTHRVSVQDLPKGTYFVKVVGQTYTRSQKITVK